MLRAPVIPFVLLFACGNASPPSSPARVPAAPSSSVAPVAAVDAGAVRISGVRVEVMESKGLPPEQITPLVLPAKTTIQHCQNGSGGKINVRITRKDGATNMSVEPGASLDPDARHCVLEALSTLGLEETGGNVAGPGGKPSGFTSLISVSW
jgi:hypothetical protein